MQHTKTLQIVFLTLAALVLTSLQGCFPLVAAGVGTGALSIADRRSTGAQLDDTSIEVKVSSRIKDEFGAAKYRIDVVSFNRRVLIVGQAATEEIKNKMTEIATAVPNVGGVTNEVAVGITDQRAGDALTTSNVKARFLTNNENRFAPNNIKVVTENSTVYLMGLVTQQEGEAAAEIARTSRGVQRVVKVFEYIDKTPEVGTAAK